MKWRNEYGDVSSDSTFRMGAILFLAVIIFVMAMGGGIAGELAGIGA